MTQRGALSHSSGNHYLSHDCGVDFAQYRRERRHAAQASAEMLERTLKLFRKWEVRHRFQKGAGIQLLPNGYNPEAKTVSKPIEFGPNGHPWGGPRNGEHMPFPGHRTQEEVQEDSKRHSELIKHRKQLRSA